MRGLGVFSRVLSKRTFTFIMLHICVYFLEAVASYLFVDHVFHDQLYSCFVGGRKETVDVVAIHAKNIFGWF